MGDMSRAYNSKVCLTDEEILYLQEIENSNETEPCIHGEPDLERLMKRTDLTAGQLRWVWTKWHDFVGPRIKELYRSSVFYQNLAAQSNGKQQKLNDLIKIKHKTEYEGYFNMYMYCRYTYIPTVKFIN